MILGHQAKVGGGSLASDGGGGFHVSYLGFALAEGSAWGNFLITKGNSEGKNAFLPDVQGSGRRLPVRPTTTPSINTEVTLKV